MNSKVLGLLAAAVMGVSGVAAATPVLVGTTTDPTGIDGLVVDGTTYDVAFSITTLNTFTQGTTQSTESEISLANALNNLGVTALGGATAGIYFIDVDMTVGTKLFDADYCKGDVVGCTAGTWLPSTFVDLSLGNNSQYYLAAADFAPVPVPASIWLILSGLAGLGLTGWRRGQTASV
jgi:hypothetical protein